MAGVRDNFVGPDHAAVDATGPAAPWIPTDIQIGANLVIVLACLFIAAVVVYLVRKRPDLGTSQALLVFAAVPMISGVGSLMSGLARVQSIGWLADAGVTFVAVSAAGIALFALKLLPGLLKMPSRAKLAEVISLLEHEIAERRLAEEALRAAHADLESRVVTRTAELYHRNRELYAEIIDHNRVEAALRETQLVLSSAQRLALSTAGFNRTKISSDLLTLLAENHPFPTSAIYRLDRRDGRFRCIAMHGMPCDGLSGFQCSQALLTGAAESGKILKVACNNAAGNASLAGDEPNPYVEALIVPVMYEERCLSIVILAGTRRFAPSDVAFVESLRVQLGATQHNLQLYADCKVMADQLHIRNLEIAEKNLQLEESSRIKSEFVANMSHELRTPLNAILGFTGTLLMGLPGPLTSEQDKQLRTVQASARHLLSLINDLLDVEKIESGKLDIKREEVVLQTAIREVFETLEPLAAQKKLDLRITMPQAPILIHTDRRALSQIIINLLNNAIKFTEAGQDSVRLSRRRTGTFGTVEVVISDSGIGILPERQSHLFRAFTQLDASSTRRFDGTGLGLYLSQRLAGLVGGELRCKSVFGKGSVFTLALPVGQA